MLTCIHRHYAFWFVGALASCQGAFETLLGTTSWPISRPSDLYAEGKGFFAAAGDALSIAPSRRFRWRIRVFFSLGAQGFFLAYVCRPSFDSFFFRERRTFAHVTADSRMHREESRKSPLYLLADLAMSIPREIKKSDLNWHSLGYTLDR